MQIKRDTTHFNERIPQQMEIDSNKAKERRPDGINQQLLTTWATSPSKRGGGGGGGRGRGGGGGGGGMVHSKSLTSGLGIKFVDEEDSFNGKEPAIY